MKDKTNADTILRVHRLQYGFLLDTHSLRDYGRLISKDNPSISQI